MVELTDYISSLINNRQNGRGGVYRCGFFSIDWYADFGKTTGALPSGKRAGEILSKNMSAVIGQDKNGITSLINSVTKVGYSKIPNGTVLDLMLHSSAVCGEEGISALYGIVKTYMHCKGLGIQINVLDPQVLKKAQKNPDEFKNLQIRLCGWNVYFVNLSKREQDEFIKMAEHSAKIV